jgi:hypothetical protein
MLTSERTLRFFIRKFVLNVQPDWPQAHNHHPKPLVRVNKRVDWRMIVNCVSQGVGLVHRHEVDDESCDYVEDSKDDQNCLHDLEPCLTLSRTLKQLPYIIHGGSFKTERPPERTVSYLKPSSFLASCFRRPPTLARGLPESATTTATTISSPRGASWTRTGIASK